MYSSALRNASRFSKVKVATHSVVVVVDVRRGRGLCDRT